MKATVRKETDNTFTILVTNGPAIVAASTESTIRNVLKFLLNAGIHHMADIRYIREV